MRNTTNRCWRIHCIKTAQAGRTFALYLDLVARRPRRTVRE